MGWGVDSTLDVEPAGVAVKAQVVEPVEAVEGFELKQSVADRNRDEWVEASVHVLEVLPD